jgi:hypothetical protein
MKKRSLIFGIAMTVCLALIFSGCEQETKTEYVNVPGEGGGELFQPPEDAVWTESIAALEALLASDLYEDIVDERYCPWQADPQ